MPKDVPPGIAELLAAEELLGKLPMRDFNREVSRFTIAVSERRWNDALLHLQRAEGLLQVLVQTYGNGFDEFYDLFYELRLYTTMVADDEMKCEAIRETLERLLKKLKKTELIPSPVV